MKMLVLYRDVGNLTKQKADEYLKHWTDKLVERIGDIPHLKVVTIPVRHQHTRIKILNLN